MERLENNPLKLFQLDPTYKLMHEGFPVLVHGTSNVIHEFFGTGLVLQSHEDAKTFTEFCRSLMPEIKEVIGDGSRAITKAVCETCQMKVKNQI